MQRRKPQIIVNQLQEQTEPCTKAKPGLTSPATLAPFGWKLLLSVIAVLLVLQNAIHEECLRVPQVPDAVTAFGVSSHQVSKAILDSDQFIASRARRTLNELAGIGIRMAGSHANEQLAVSWLVRELDNLKKQVTTSASKHRLTLSVDYVSGFFDIDFLDGFTSVYTNVSNVLARIDPVGGDTENALLINSHYDTQMETPGASDDAVSIAISLELLRAILASPQPLKHSVIFLFNGAEENILQATTGFISGRSQVGNNVDGSGHPWAKHVRAFLNLEACGSGGKEAMFQAGPGQATPILVRAYAKAAPMPYGSVIGLEIFQSGIIPSDTDFRVFRDEGHIPGMDFAFIANGYVYHTAYDTADRIPEGSIHRAGVNLLAVIRHLAASDLANMPRVADPRDFSGEKLVYFDLFSRILVVYPFETVGLALNWLAVAATFYRVAMLVFSEKHQRKGISYGQIVTASVIAHLLTVVSVLLVSLAIAVVVSQTAGCMAWYGQQWLVFPIYILPSTAIAFLIHSAFFKHVIAPRCQTADFEQQCETAYDVSMDGALIISSIFVAVLSLNSIASSFVFLIWTGFPLLGAALFGIVAPLSEPGRHHHNTGTVLIFRHCCLTLFPSIYTIYLGNPIAGLFIPITGRMGGNANPEVVIAIIIFVITILLLIFHVKAFLFHFKHSAFQQVTFFPPSLRSLSVVRFP